MRLISTQGDHVHLNFAKMSFFMGNGFRRTAKIWIVFAPKPLKRLSVQSKEPYYTQTAGRLKRKEAWRQSKYYKSNAASEAYFVKTWLCFHSAIYPNITLWILRWFHIFGTLMHEEIRKDHWVRHKATRWAAVRVVILPCAEVSLFRDTPWHPLEFQ